MTEKVFLVDIKRTQNSCSPLCLYALCGKKQNQFHFRCCPPGQRIVRGGIWRILSQYGAVNIIYIYHSLRRRLSLK